MAAVSFAISRPSKVYANPFGARATRLETPDQRSGKTTAPGRVFLSAAGSGRSAKGRFRRFAEPSANGRCLRFQPVRRADHQGLLRAESAPTRVASGRTGVRAKAAVPLEREIAFTA